MASPRVKILELSISLIIAVSVYWALLLLLDTAAGTRQIHAWILFESRNALLKLFLHDTAYLFLAFIPALLLCAVSLRSPRPGGSMAIVQPVLIALVAGGVLLVTGQTLTQAGLYIVSALLAVLLARSTVSLICRMRA